MSIIKCRVDGHPLGWRPDSGTCMCPPDRCLDRPVAPEPKTADDKVVAIITGPRGMAG